METIGSTIDMSEELVKTFRFRNNQHPKAKEQVVGTMKKHTHLQPHLPCILIILQLWEGSWDPVDSKTIGFPSKKCHPAVIQRVIYR